MITTQMAKTIQAQLASLRAEENTIATEDQLEFDFEGVHTEPSVSAVDIQSTCYGTFNGACNEDYELSYDMLEQYREFAQRASEQMKRPDHRKRFKKCLKEIYELAVATACTNNNISDEIRLNKNLNIFKQVIDNI